MERYKIITLVDITRTNAPRNESDRLKVGQQANFNSILQAIGLRSNMTWDKDPEMHTGRLPDEIEGKANHWVWEFTVERDFVFLKNNDDPVGLLIDDLHGVPIVIDLNNNVEISPAAIQTKGNNINTWVKVMSKFNLG
jgi:hypothetical protein